MLHLHTVYPYTLRRSAVHVLRTLAVLAARSARRGRRTYGPIGSSRSPSVLLALLAVAVVPPARSVPAARRARLPAPVCASADAWSTVDFFVRRPCVACLACPLSVCVWARVLAALACPRPCARVRGRCPPTFQSLAVHFIRL